MDKVDQYIKAGAVRRGDPAGSSSGDSDLEPTPFVKWPNERAFVAGEVTGLWDGLYGKVAEGTGNVTIRVNDHSPGLEGDAKGTRALVTVGKEVNVGLNNSTLNNTATEADKGKTLLFAFDGWKEPSKAGGNRYRLFTVLEIPAGQLNGHGVEAPVVEAPVPAVSLDDSLPF